MMAQVKVDLEGLEMFKRRGEGKVVFFFQITDEAGRVYQDHTAYDLGNVQKPAKNALLTVTESVFVEPGDYQILCAMYFTATGEHAVKKDKLHVAAIEADPLLEIGRTFPPVDFVEASQPPDSWYQPKERGRCDLRLSPSHPVQIELVANLASADLRVMLPRLKVLSQMKGPNVAVNLTVLDVGRRRVVLRQRNLEELAWPTLRATLPSANPGLIDVKALANREKDAAFFFEEIAARLGPDRVVIVLSDAMNFEVQQEAPAGSLPGGEILYIRGRTPFPTDELAPVLGPSRVRIMDVGTPMDFRRALAAIVSEVNER
jgi:hypothetical protein